MSRLFSSNSTQFSFERFFLALIFLVSLNVGRAQLRDSLPESGPSICECLKYSKDDPQLLSRCEQKFDYNLMSSFQQSAFKKKLESCTDPEICDCIERGPKDPELQKACDKKFIESEMDEKALEKHLEDKKECHVRSEKPPLKLVCECVNGTAEETRSERCKAIWNISNLTGEERQTFVEEISACLENKGNEDFTLGICDCLNADDEDYELKERCITKFDLNTLSEEEIVKLKAKSVDCQIYPDDEFDLICSCVKEERKTGKMSPNCIKLLGGLEDKYTNLPPEELQLFIERLMECVTED